MITKTRKATIEHNPLCGIGKSYRIVQLTNAMEIGLILTNRSANEIKSLRVGDALDAKELFAICNFPEWEVTVKLAK